MLKTIISCSPHAPKKTIYDCDKIHSLFRATTPIGSKLNGLFNRYEALNVNVTPFKDPKNNLMVIRTANKNMIARVGAREQM